MGRHLLELSMNFENSGNFLHRNHISQNFQNLQIQKHSHDILFALWTSGGWRALYKISLEW